jgi:hypothetical protein
MAGLFGLVAIGAEDFHISGSTKDKSPLKTFFKQEIDKHTLFSKEYCELKPDKPAEFGKIIKYRITKYGDLINGIYLEIKLPKIQFANGIEWKWTPSLGFAMIEYIEFNIGGMPIDKHPGEWLKIWYELSVNSHKHSTFDKFVGNIDVENTADATLIIPLQFFFNRFTSQALPLIAIQHFDFYIIIKFRPLRDLLITNRIYKTTDTRLNPDEINVISEPKIHLHAEYIYLDTDERRKFTQTKHEYLITLLQHQEFIIEPETHTGIQLNSFTRPVRELIFTVQPIEHTISGITNSNNRWCDFGNPGCHLFESVQLILNGGEKSKMKPDFLRVIQNNSHHTNVPRENIYTISFGLAPEDQQPNGTVNMSRLDSVSLKFAFNEFQYGPPLKVNVYAPHFNVLRFESGLFGLAYY